MRSIVDCRPAIVPGKKTPNLSISLRPARPTQLSSHHVTCLSLMGTNSAYKNTYQYLNLQNPKPHFAHLCPCERVPDLELRSIWMARRMLPVLVILCITGSICSHLLAREADLKRACGNQGERRGSKESQGRSSTLHRRESRDIDEA